MEHKTGCLICGKPLAYFDAARPLACVYCSTVKETNAACVGGHYVCDGCHSGSANELIEKYCINTISVDPMEQAVLLMNNPAVKMHGPEHHFLVPAVLLSAYFNKSAALPEDKAEAIRQARKRAEDVKGGFCGLQGACGSAIGTGIFISIVSKSTPLSRSEWRLSNLMTAETLTRIAENDGPRCCKRSSFLAICQAVEFVNRQFGVPIRSSEAVCTFSALNKECHYENCSFWRA